MKLDSSTKSLEIVLGSAVQANQLPVIVSYDQVNVYGGGSQESTTNGITAVTILDAPEQGAKPVFSTVKSISVPNIDTISHEVTIQLNNNATIKKITPPFVLAPKDVLYYESGRGWYVLDKFGATKVPPTTGEDMIYIVLSGTDTYTGSHPKVTSYYEGLMLRVKVPNNNTGASTVNINGLGAKDLRNFGASALTADELEAGTIYDLTYDGTKFQISSTTDKIQNNV